MIMFRCNNWIRKYRLQRQLRRLQRGQLSKSTKRLNEKKQQRHLAALTHAAYADGTLLGVNQYSGEYAALPDSLANLHTLLIGTTGSGKTTTLGNVIESAILRALPLFCVDGKGDLDLAHRVRDYARQHQRPFYLFSMVGESVRYNPLASGGFTAKKDRIIELREWSEDHYRKIAEGYLQTVFRLLEATQQPIDLCTLARYLKPDALYELVRPQKNAALTDEVESLKPYYKDMQSLIAEIENMTRSEIGALFDCQSGSVLTLKQALAEKAIVYFCLQPLAFPAYAQLLGKVIINDLKHLFAQQLSAPQSQKTKVYCIFDEFSTFAGEQVIHLINQGRGAGAHVILSTQSLSDLVHQSGEAFLGKVLNNVNHYIIQRQNNPDDAERLAAIIGTEDKFQLTSQLSSDQYRALNGSITAVKSFIVHPDQIKRLRLGEAITVNKKDFSVQWVRLRKSTI